MENTNNIPTAYEGKEPYIFVSYAHKDSEKVVPVVRALKDAGFRVWYDEGLVQGENYHEDIAEHIALCTTALVFLSSASANSTYCKMEIEYAFSCGKKLSVVYLEENVALSPGIQLLLNSIQSLMYSDYGSQEDFTQALFQTPCLQICAEKDSLYFELTQVNQNTFTIYNKRPYLNNKLMLTFICKTMPCQRKFFAL